MPSMSHREVVEVEAEILSSCHGPREAAVGLSLSEVCL